MEHLGHFMEAGVIIRPTVPEALFWSLHHFRPSKHCRSL